MDSVVGEDSEENRRNEENNSSSCFSQLHKASDSNNSDLNNSPIHSYCIGFIDIVDSTLNVKKIRKSKDIQLYYSTFLNETCSTIKKFGGSTIKNLGDSLLYYFSKTVDSDNEYAFKKVIDCSLSLVDNKDNLNAKLSKGLPKINYRISMDYGEIELSLLHSDHMEFFGSVLYRCQRMNHMAPPNEIVIGDCLYQTIRKFNSFKDLLFQQTIPQNYDSAYPVYIVRCKNIPKVLVEKNNGDTKAVMEKYQGLQYKKEPVKILLVDDDEDVLFSFRCLLENEGYSTKAISDSKEVLKHFSDNHYCYDLLILDIRMPDVNGIQLYSKLKTMCPDVKVLFVTALDLVNELSCILSSNSKNIVKKPVNNDQFISKVKSILVKEDNLNY